MRSSIGSIQRSAAAVDPSGSAGARTGRPVRGMTVDGQVTIPATAGSLDQGAGRSVLTHELVHVQQQRDLGAAMPAPGSESAHRLESAARLAESAVAWEELTLARPQSRPLTTPDSTASAAMTVSRSVGAPVPIGAQPSMHAAMQLADGDAPAPAPDTSAPVTSAAPASAPAGSPGAGATPHMSDRDLEEMLHRLYPRVRRHLSTDLLVARERAGMLADRR